MNAFRFGSALSFIVVVSACTANPAASEDTAGSEDDLSVTSSFTARGTAYYPANNALEGGFTDRRGVRLKTLQQFLAGSASYVSVAMDANAFRYGQRLRIRELDAKYGKPIVFRVVDTGGAFRGKGRSRIDVCVGSRAASYDPTINGTLHIDVINEAGGGTAPDPAPDPAPTQQDPEGPAGGGAACKSDGACNPGNDGSGLICVGGQCVPGCHIDAQCPGATTCVSGQCL